MLAYLAQNTRNKGKNILSIHSPTKEAENFYTEKCGFRKTGKTSGLEISNEAFDQLINQNSEHTKGKIQVVI